MFFSPACSQLLYCSMFSTSPVISSRLRVPGLFSAMVLRDADNLASRTRSWPIAVHDPGWNISKQGMPVVRESDILGVRKHGRMNWALRMTGHNAQQVGLGAFLFFSFFFFFRRTCERPEEQTNWWST